MSNLYKILEYFIVAFPLFWAQQAFTGERQNHFGSSHISSPVSRSPAWENYHLGVVTHSEFNLIPDRSQVSGRLAGRTGLLSQTSGSAPPAWKLWSAPNRYHWLP